MPPQGHHPVVTPPTLVAGDSCEKKDSRGCGGTSLFEGAHPLLIVFKELINSQSIKGKTIKTASYSSAPTFLKFNPNITEGYRLCSSVEACLLSTLHWTNETLNIWTHFLGFLVFFYVGVEDIQELQRGEISLLEGFIKLGVLFCFMCCMLLSTLYHTFCCCSPTSYRKWLTADLIGVSMSLLGIYLSGIFFAFEGNQFWLQFYLITVLLIFSVAMATQFIISDDERTEDGFHWRLLLFGAWAAYGVVPTFHWVFITGLSDDKVQHLLPRIMKMYFLCALAFGTYLTRFPERIFPGRVNFIGSSHQLWHLLIFIALFYWYTVVGQHFSYTKNF